MAISHYEVNEPIFTVDLQQPSSVDCRKTMFEFAAAVCTQISFVKRHEFKFSKQCDDCMSQIEPFLVKVETVSQWPGTSIAPYNADLYTYRFNSQMKEVIDSFGVELIAWLEPDFPEDPVLYNKDGSPLLVTISHESDLFFFMKQHEYEALVRIHPECSFSLQPYSTSESV